MPFAVAEWRDRGTIAAFRLPLRFSIFVLRVSLFPLRFLIPGRRYLISVSLVATLERPTMPQLSKATQTSLSDINMVPFIDVVLVLLIIFMITAPILQSGIEVDLPKTHTVKEILEQRLVVTIDKSQRIYLGNDPVNIHQLPDKIRKQLKHPQDAIFLRCDETVPFGSFATVVDSLRVAGFSNISIVTEPISERRR